MILPLLPIILIKCSFSDTNWKERIKNRKKLKKIKIQKKSEVKGKEI